MKANEYQEWTLTTAIYPEAGTGSNLELQYLALGLASEAGEVAGKIKKLIRDGKLDIGDVMAETGDVLWYVVRLIDALGMDVELCMEMNKNKLMSRKEKGTISGSGDAR